MHHPLSASLLAGMLLLLPGVGAFGKEPAAHGTQCPAPADVRHEAGRYRAPARIEVASGRGEWSSTPQADIGRPRHLSVLYYGKRSDTATSTGVLVNCSYTLRNGKDVDLAYFDQQTPQTQRNLIVALQHPAVWLLDQPPAPGEDLFYVCTRSPKDCAFETLRLE
ncbi:DUF3757 domain-containing protein [Xanthomonas arboricola]|nr:DUF3757 domain-containing protein [Xanthomonas arboricola]